jgi:hypothetical protein
MNRVVLAFTSSCLLVGCASPNDPSGHRRTTPGVRLERSAEKRILSVSQCRRIHPTSIAYTWVGHYCYLFVKGGFEPDFPCEESICHYWFLIRKHESEPDWSTAQFCWPKSMLTALDIPIGKLREMDRLPGTTTVAELVAKLMARDPEFIKDLIVEDDPIVRE